MAVHLYGQTCEMETLNEIATKYNLKVIEDSAQSHGAFYKERELGIWVTVPDLVFIRAKSGALGDGGLITTNDEELANCVRILGNYGSSKKYINNLKGIQ